MINAILKERMSAAHMHSCESSLKRLHRGSAAVKVYSPLCILSSQVGHTKRKEEAHLYNTHLAQEVYVSKS